MRLYSPLLKKRYAPKPLSEKTLFIVMHIALGLLLVALYRVVTADNLEASHGIEASLLYTSMTLMLVAILLFSNIGRAQARVQRQPLSKDDLETLGHVFERHPAIEALAQEAVEAAGADGLTYGLLARIEDDALRIIREDDKKDSPRKEEG